MTDNSKPKGEAPKLVSSTESPKPASSDDLLTMSLEDFANRAAGEIAANLRRKTAEPEKPDDDPTP